MKFSSIILFGVIVTSSIIKTAVTHQDTLFAVAGKFLGKGKNKNSVANAPVQNQYVPVNSMPEKKPSKMSKIIDLGTNVAMAVAGAGTLYSAMSDGAPRTPKQVR